ncbi:MAG: fused MFS/spermidine synthase [Elusimicrobia bacterium]|nr:fused MFS/spermidine synthase [Elusimicrobiota bacterium]
MASFLVFHLELVLVKELLPRYGGGAYVWTTSVAVFQGLVLAAALYAVLARRGGRARYGVHLAFVAAGAFGAIAPRDTRVAGSPGVDLALALVLAAGPALFALAATTAVLDDWAGAAEARGLYAASNAGALAALGLFPLVLEPWVPLDRQRHLWWGLYLLEFGLLASCRPGASRERTAAAPPSEPGRGWAWAAAAAAPSAGLVAATNALGLDLASGPLLWAAPLGLYLLTIVLAFRGSGPDLGRAAALSGALALAWAAAFGAAALAALSGAAWAAHAPRAVLTLGRVGLDLGALCFLGLACHRALAAAKPPDPDGAPAFYAWVAAGAWAGSAAASWLLPLIAPNSGVLTLEWLVAAALAAVAAKTAAAGGRRLAAGAGGALAAFAVGARLWTLPPSERVVDARRTFYGIYTVTEGGGARAFYHGTTRHGVQFLDAARARRPVSYFSDRGPLGDTFRVLEPRRVGVVGLGVGTMAVYRRPGQRWVFFELDPEVVSIATRHFSYVSRSEPGLDIRVGDARVELAEGGAPFDLLVIDAFHSGAVPTHLATREAVELYGRRLGAGGVLLIHVSSRLIDLRPMLAGLGAELGWAGATRRLEASQIPPDERTVDASTWVALAADPRSLDGLRGAGWEDLLAGPRARPWTDRRASLLPALF